MIGVFPEVSGRILINGDWKKVSKTKKVINPAKIEEVVGEVALCSTQDVDDAIKAASDVFKSWSRTSVEERADRMRQASEKLSPLVEENVSLLVRENGKTLVESKKDLLRCIQVMNQMADTLIEWWKPVDLSGALQSVQIRRRARGVTAVISPWNSPLILTFKRVIPAVLAGNTVVIKPATNCPLTVLTFLKAVASSFPPGVINIVTGSGAMIGEVLCSDPRVKAICFTGSTDTGKTIMRQAASTVKKLYMELGGNDPALILPDAALDRTDIERIRGGVLRASGQVCSAIKRIYVHESRYVEFVDKLKSGFERVVVGNGIHPDTTMGPLNNKGQFDYVKGLVERTKQSGAQVAELGQKLNSDSWEEGYFMNPSIVTNISHDSELVHAEQFGPVIPVIPYTELSQAIEMANDTQYGLRASVWTSDERKAAEIADYLEAGAVFHNNHTIFKDLRLDFPGIKESGFSKETQWGSLELFTDSYGFAN
ncbi:acyl-CoA reductase-like NAD-dependent aldehyde dehydrogenase [Scopulibacillus darangshiensis]|uniref:Acyl-CoA reductase-like NAD-dependent aldehyde dehydrogenase n=1 Tax=Scopulibacillus darangshiensis TaxID=442528 RepID=A0A4R2PCA2_9BACL|nr:aldehyde dehydrogenase family protein [Scopulibacillus darangshiensis]TCP31711.1 acyl-CoA reductase-like NAD-dependent aldehyde dehydrogenase [Scopulibacillus darangshiensis]